MTRLLVPGSMTADQIARLAWRPQRVRERRSCDSRAVCDRNHTHTRRAARKRGDWSSFAAVSWLV